MAEQITTTPPVSNFWQNPRVRLRAIEPGDAETFHRWNQDSERARNLDFIWPPVSLASQRVFAEEASRRKMENDRLQWIIETIDGTPVGMIDTHHCDHRTGNFSYGVDIAGEHRGKGYAAEAIRLVLRYYFDELRYQKVTVNVHADNLASLRLHEKLGFQREGLLRRTQYSHGCYIDEIFFGMTVEEFRALYGSVEG